MSAAQEQLSRSVGTLDRSAVAVRAVMVLLVLAFAASILPGVRDQAGFVPVYDKWLQASAYVACAVVATVEVLRLRHHRATWSVLAVAVMLRAVAFVLFLFWVRTAVPLVYPSVADLCWLLSAAMLLVFVALRVRSVAPRAGLLLLLDGVAAALIAAGIGIELISFALATADGALNRAALTNLAYPIVDVALAVMVVGLVVACRWRPSRSDLAVMAGITGFAILDVTFLFQVSNGTYRAGTWLAALSMLSTAVIAGAAALRRPEATTRPVGEEPPGVYPAASIGVVGLVFIVYATFTPVPVVSVLLVTGGLLILIARAVATLVGDRADAAERLQISNEDMVRFQALVETSEDFIAIAGMDGQVLFVNPAGKEMVGLSRDQNVTGTSITDFLTEEGVQRSLDVEQPAVVAHGRWEGESTLRDLRGGPPIPVAISSFLMHHPRTGEPLALATVQRDITERQATARAVEELARTRQMLLARLVQAQEDERAAIAADVHDDSVQALAAVDLRLGLLRRRVGELEDPSLAESVDKTLETVRGATARLRHLLFDLESPALNSTLAQALEAAADFVFEDAEVECALIGEPTVDLPTAQRVTAYRIAKEAMTNARKHARASRVEIGLTGGDDGVLVTIADDGIGMSGRVRHRSGHHGLASARDRATVAGGWLRVEAAEGEGTRVFVWLPNEAPTDGVEEHEEEDVALGD